MVRMVRRGINMRITNLFTREILHDEKTYPNPHAFCPERFLHTDGTFNYDVQTPEVAAFGYGRR